MQFSNVDIKRNVFIVAEVGNNHEGNFSVAQKMITAAAKAKADAVKFQTFVPELYCDALDIDRRSVLEKFQLSFKQFELLSRQANDEGLVFFSTPFDLESAKFLNSIQDVFKISSGDNNFIPLINLICTFGKPTMVSSGLTDFEEISDIHQRWHKNLSANELIILHCVSAYPVQPEEACLSAIQTLREQFPTSTIGYSDHTIGSMAATAAVSLGARIVEKHFTLDHDMSSFRDHKISSNPKQFSDLVDKIRETEMLTKDNRSKKGEAEKQNLIAMRRSLAAAVHIPAGTLLSEEHITWVRPGDGYSPKQISVVLGKKTTKNLQRGQVFRMGDIH